MADNHDFSQTCSTVMSRLITCYLVVLVLVFPLIYHHAYVDILEVKYMCYYITVIAMLATSLIAATVMMALDYRRYGGKNTKRIIGALHPRKWRETFHAADAAVLLFWIAALISTLQSDYLYEAFWGNEGRYTGLFLLTLYVCAYFLISRCWKVRGWCLQLFLVSGVIMCIIGITDYFQLDVLDFRGPVLPEESAIFTSTVGNINTYTAYVGLVMGFSAALYMVEKKFGKRLWYYICFVISLFAIIMGCSDNAYLGLAALFGLSPFALFRNKKGVQTYLTMLATFFSVIQCIDWLNQIYAARVIGLDSLFRMIAGLRGLFLIVVLLWAMTGAYAYVSRRENYPEKIIGKLLVRCWAALLAVVILAAIFVLYDANAGGHAERYSAAANYLVFDDAWGTYRGYIWKASVKTYQEFPLIRKLFGYGPDTFGILALNELHLEMVNATGLVFDNAHNEYLQYLVTIGIVGAGAYITFLLTAFYRMKCCWGKNIYAAGALGATVCYAAQAVVNLNLPIAAPIMWLMLSVGMAGCREVEDNYGETKISKTE